MKRRDFIKKTAMGTAMVATGLPALGKSANSQVKLTILHTADTHSRIEAFPATASKYAGRGGYAARASLVDKIRATEQNVLLFDSGDMVQGTPYFNFYKGELEMKLMSKMKYDLATIGNHEFDNGLSGIEYMLQFAEFPWIISNYDFSNTILANRFAPYKIFEKQGLKIGVFAVGVELDGLVWGENFGATQYLDPIAVSREMVQELRNNQGCDLIVCLSHLGYDYEGAVCDTALAKQVAGVDIILGGHSHTFMEESVFYTNPEGEQVLVNHSGWSGVNLGRIDLTYDLQKKKKRFGGKNMEV
ncbi:metallophosphoesterase [Persicobacter diffluens]|uniref:Metallophosphatase n=1 Tax=Persicobacter diffluens TaxID=981 RepID=A0AAN4VZR5_9BACT|nr:metallophosphatase [Persicobacter diffluens]